MTHSLWNRRQFISTSMTAWAAGTIAGNRKSMAQGRAAVRETSGDRKEQPNWSEKLTMTVGPQKGDLVGNSDKAIQAAVDYVARLGGGTVQLGPGEYQMRNGIQMQSNVRLLGSGSETVLKKNEATSSMFVEDSDWFDQEITLKPGHGFQVGDGVTLITKNTGTRAKEVLTRTLVARSGDRFKLNKALRKNYWQIGEAKAISLFSLIQCDHVENIQIENLVLDGNRKNNPNLNGNYGGAIFAQDCRTMKFDHVEARNYNGDGFSWQICHDVVVEKCHSHDNADLGFHPGSGSQRPIMRNNKISNTNIGIFFCWGVRNGLAENNEIVGCKHGISVGHRDTHNLIRNNKVSNSGQYGILFRPERGAGFTGDFNRVENNELVNNGAAKAIGLDVQGLTANLEIVGNTFKETRKMGESVGIQLGAQTKSIALKNNSFAGFNVDVKQLS